MSVLQIFRAAAAAGDARDAAPASQRQGDARMISARRRASREGSDEASLRRDLALDIASLLNTVRLDAAIDLGDAPYVERSVINYGFRDLSSLTRSNETARRIAEAIRETLIRHETRLNPRTIEVRATDRSSQSDQRLFFDIVAEMIASPADIPMDFVAEVDMGAGKLRMLPAESVR
ncbi:type VI secretion system baseplate subunit TssE (plasmid) [Paracoccus sp. TK19116]|uniref:Type VI secretion system baseplate subunit TssE n=1 Tax=Paracoccus albicereus TaxID=2922394 RepID=A0ABT1MM49_9RHOB|nr:type VI secretion system baseplate subunit TssE [Paracoccus albicereus]MCQ0969174.1 type VI secretion system baseplate subunit TssE [Paracoccus albicereus]